MSNRNLLKALIRNHQPSLSSLIPIKKRQTWGQCKFKMIQNLDTLLTQTTLKNPKKEFDFLGEPSKKLLDEKDYYLKKEGYFIKYATEIFSAINYLLRKSNKAISEKKAQFILDHFKKLKTILLNLDETYLSDNLLIAKECFKKSDIPNEKIMQGKINHFNYHLKGIKNSPSVHLSLRDMIRIGSSIAFPSSWFKYNWSEHQGKMKDAFDNLLQGTSLNGASNKTNFIGEPSEQNKINEKHFLEKKGYLINYAMAITNASKYLFYKQKITRQPLSPARVKFVQYHFSKLACFLKRNPSKKLAELYNSFVLNDQGIIKINLPPLIKRRIPQKDMLDLKVLFDNDATHYYSSFMLKSQIEKKIYYAKYKNDENHPLKKDLITIRNYLYDHFKDSNSAGIIQINRALNNESIESLTLSQQIDLFFKIKKIATDRLQGDFLTRFQFKFFLFEKKGRSEAADGFYNILSNADLGTLKIQPPLTPLFKGRNP